MKKTLILLLILFPIIASANIGVGTFTRLSNFATTNLLSGSSPSVSGVNVLGVVACADNNAATMTGATWNSVDMTEVTNASSADSSTGIKIYYVVSPPLGVSTVALSASSNWTSAFCEVYYFTGVNLLNPIDTSNAGVGAVSSTLSRTIVSNNPNEFAIDSVTQLTAGSISVTAPSLLGGSGNTGNVTAFSFGSSYQGNIATPSTVTMAWSSTVSKAWRQGIILLNPAKYNNQISTIMDGKMLFMGGKMTIN